MTQASQEPAWPVEIAGIRLELIERGKGRPILFLHPGIGIDPQAPVLDSFASQGRLIAPSHPGFGRSDLPPSMSTIDDLAYYYLDLMDDQDLKDVLLVGVSFGAWIAAEIAIKSTARISHLVLADAVGIKVGDRESRDIVDMFAVTERRFAELAYADIGNARLDYKDASDADVKAVARNREAVARFGWSPYLHDPKLKGRLHRIRIPTLVLWGEQDRVVSQDYGKAYAGLIPGAKFETVPKAGHYPHIEQPDEFAKRVFAFAGK